MGLGTTHRSKWDESQYSVPIDDSPSIISTLQTQTHTHTVAYKQWKVWHESNAVIKILIRMGNIHIYGNTLFCHKCSIGVFLVVL